MALTGKSRQGKPSWISLQNLLIVKSFFESSTGVQMFRPLQSSPSFHWCLVRVYSSLPSLPLTDPLFPSLSPFYSSIIQISALSNLSKFVSIGPHIFGAYKGGGCLHYFRSWFLPYRLVNSFKLTIAWLIHNTSTCDFQLIQLTKPWKQRLLFLCFLKREPWKRRLSS